MASKPAEEWREPSPGISDEGSSDEGSRVEGTGDEGGSSSTNDSDKSYEEEVITPRQKRRGPMEEELDPTYMLEKTGHSTKNSRTPRWDDDGRVSK
jgi:hypothetical protein